MVSEGPGRFFVTSGTLKHDAASYVERAADAELIASLRQGEYCYVLDSRQMGKSSLMARTAERLRLEGLAVATVDLTQHGINVSIDQWYYGLLHRIGRQIGLNDELAEFWRSHGEIGPMERWMTALQRVVCRHGSPGLVIFIDEIDVVSALPFSTDEFFAGIRECYNRRAEDPTFDRLAFCLVGVAAPSDLIRDPHMTPFNIGRRVELTDFNEEEAAILLKGLGREPAVASALLRRVLYWTGGYPYLTQRLCQAIAEDPGVVSAGGVDRHCAALFLSRQARERDSNLGSVSNYLLRSDKDLVELLDLYARVRSGRPVVDSETNPLVSHLKLSGVTRSERGFLRVRNRIYARVFDWEWVRESMPDAELLRREADIRRGRLQATVVSSVVVTAMAGLARAAAVQSARTRAALDKERDALCKANVALARAGRLSTRAGRRFEGLEALSQAAGIRPSLEIRNEAIACMALVDLRIAEQWVSRSAESHDLPVPDQRMERWAFSDDQGNISVRWIGSNHETAYLPGPGRPLYDGRWSPDGRLLAACYANLQPPYAPLFLLWDITQCTLVWRKDWHVRCLEFSPDGGRLALGQQDGSIVVLDVITGRDLSCLPRGPYLWNFRFDPSGQRLAIGSEYSPEVKIRDVSTGEEIASLGHPGVVRGLDWSPDGKRLATGCSDYHAYIWNVDERQLATDMMGHRSDVLGVSFNHQNDLLASTSWDNSTRLWDPVSGRELVAHPFGAWYLTFSPDDRLLGYFLEDSRVKRWAVASGRECRTLRETRAEPRKGPLSLDFSPDGRLIAAACSDGVRLWDVATGAEVEYLDIGQDFRSSGVNQTACDAQPQRFIGLTHSVFFLPTGPEVLTSGDDGIQRRPILQSNQNVNNGVLLDHCPHWSTARDREEACLTPDGRTVVAHGDHIHIVSLEGGSRKLLLPGQQGMMACAISPDGRWAATPSWWEARPEATSKQEMTYGAVSIWEATTWNLIETLPCKGRARVAFSSDGKWLVTGTAKEYCFWSAGSWRPGHRIQRLVAGLPGFLAFNRDGTLLAVAISDSAVLLIDPATGRELATLEAPDPQIISGLRFSPDGRQLAVACETHSIQLWDLPLIRNELTAMGLDWDLPPYPPDRRLRE